jgi:hypothetical protein
MSDRKYKAAHSAWGCGYFLAFIGAAVYYLQIATSFWDGVVGILKAIVWPAFVTYNLAKFLEL